MLNLLKTSQSPETNYWTQILFTAFISGGLRKFNERLISILEEAADNDADVSMEFNFEEFVLVVAIFQVFRLLPEHTHYIETLEKPPTPSAQQMKSAKLKLDRAIEKLNQDDGGMVTWIENTLSFLAANQPELKLLYAAAHLQPDDKGEIQIDERVRPMVQSLLYLHGYIAAVWPPTTSQTDQDNSNRN